MDPRFKSLSWLPAEERVIVHDRVARTIVQDYERSTVATDVASDYNAETADASAG